MSGSMVQESLHFILILYSEVNSFPSKKLDVREGKLHGYNLMNWPDYSEGW